MTSEPIVLSVEAACRELSLSEPTMPRRVGYLRSDIEAYLQRQREQAFAA